MESNEEKTTQNQAANEDIVPNKESIENTTDSTIIEPDSNAQEENSFQSQFEELNDKYIRLFAEFDNFKRRTTRERIDLVKTANADVLKSLLSVLDDFDRANKSIAESTDISALQEGISLVHQKLKSTLQQQGLKEMGSSIGKEFDTDLHEAITNIPAPSEEMKGKIIDEIEKGYYLNDKVLRFAKVIVGS